MFVEYHGEVSPDGGAFRALRSSTACMEPTLTVDDLADYLDRRS